MEARPNLKRKAEGEPEIEPQQQQPNKKFKFSLGASGPAPPPPSAAPTPMAPPQTAAPTPAPRPAMTPATAGITNALNSNDSVSAREALIRELQALDKELVDLDMQMAAPAPAPAPARFPPQQFAPPHPVAPVHHHPQRQRTPKRPIIDGGEIDDFGRAPSQKIRTTPPAQNRPVAPMAYSPAAAPKRKPHEPALPPPQWTRGPRVPLKSGVSEEKLWDEAKQINRELLAHQWAYPFMQPVDPIALGIPDYPLVIRNPMDLGTIKTRLTKRFYQNIKDYINDTRLVWNNAMTFNAPQTDVFKMAETLSKIFEKRAADLVKMTKKDPREELRQIRDQHTSLEAQRRQMEEEETLLEKDRNAIEEVAPLNFIFPPQPQVAPPLTYEEKVQIYNTVNSLNEQQAAGLIELIKQTQPDLLAVDAVVLDLNVDELYNGLLRRMEAFLAANGIVSTVPFKSEPAYQPPQTSYAAPSQYLQMSENVKNESIDVEDKRISESSSSSDDESPMLPSSVAVPAPTPSSFIPQISPTPSASHDTVGSKMPKIIQNNVEDEKPANIVVNEASWGSLESDDKAREGGNAAEQNALWSEFKNRTAQQLQLEKEKEEREQALKRAQQQQIEEQKRLAQEAEEREREAQARLEREREEELDRKREQARLQREQATPQVDLLEQSALMKEFQNSLNQ